ncbi:KAT8 regulatory NSL complex subunit 1-like [Haliotis asinina]|uniref:KAT8 regulatory NSL complex subunit 1-like n=1 Tax=Haliotis asinina TaxID=109174 RepID=UPI003531F772
MSSPLPLRICCMAAMAPALTEAASQVRIKATLPATTTPSVTTPTTVLNGKDHKLTTQHELAVVDSRLSLDKVQRSTKQVTNLAGHLLNGGHSVKLNTCNLATNLQNLGVTAAISNLHKKEVSAFQSEFIKSFVKLEKGGMNQPASKNENTKPETLSPKEQSESTLFVNGKSSVTDVVKDEQKSCERDTSSDPNSSNVDHKLSGNDAVIKGQEEDSRSSNPKLDLENNESIKTTEDLKECVSTSQHQLQRRAEFLLRRLRRIQGRQIENHTRQQLHHFVEYQHKNLETVVKSINAPVTGTELKTELLQSEDVKNLSTAALVNLVRKLQAPKNLSLNQRLVHPPKTEAVIQTTTNILKMDKSVRNESETAADHLCSTIKSLESVVDSDATESSSGGESCDEFDGDLVKEKKGPSPPLHRRADWKWAFERASVAARWTWLQAQVSDLEYRIRQQSEIYKQIRNSKGSIVLGDAPSPQNLLTRFHPAGLKTIARPAGSDNRVTSLDQKNEMSPCNISTVLSNVDKQASRLSQSLGNCLSPQQNSIKSSTPSTGRSLNGFIESPIGNSDDASSDTPVADVRLLVDKSDISVVDPTTQAARCRPLRSYRKRKLLRTFGLHQTSRKAARLSTVKCECYPPVMPCPMCGGRYNNAQTVQPEVMPVQERVSLLDASFHPVLSFPQEIPLPVHFEALLKSGEWQHKPPPKRAKTETERKRHKGKGSENSRKANRQIRKNAAAVLLSSKIRSKYENKTVRKGHNTTRKKAVSTRRLNKDTTIRRRAQQIAIAMKRRSGRSMSALQMSVMEANQGPLASPQTKDGLSLSCPSSAFKDLKNRRSRGEAYDINNIVIPYSIAAATRVEKLQYKEIVTPKWRDITLDKENTSETVIGMKDDFQEPMEVDGALEKTNGLIGIKPVEIDEENEEIEDLCDDIYVERHLKCEVEEKKRFTSFIQYPSRRSRTRTETSTPLTEPSSPDPNSTPTDTLAPIELPLTESMIQPIQPPSQATPSTPTFPATSYLLASAAGFDEGSRRRSGSVSRRERLSFSSVIDESSQDGFMELGEIVDPWPLRTFPLSEEEFENVKKVQLTSEKVRPRVSLEPPSTPCRSDSTPSNSHPCSPLPSSASNSVAGDDPNDPEWTVINNDRTPRKMSVVLKLSTGKR